ILDACKICFPEAAGFFSLNSTNIQSTTQLIIKRYQTKTDSFSVISLPNTPVKPARKTAICNWRNAFFMEKAKKDYFPSTTIFWEK
ncbi:MAG TPA: hypothetical protein VII44_08950, partial [Puia sp.]